MSLFVGLISGTSVDGVDAVLTDVGAGTTLIHAHQHPFTESLRERLLSANTRNQLRETLRLDVEVSHHFADAVDALLCATGVKHAAVTAIGSHGQTICHYPDDEPPFTYQIGDPNVLAERTGITTVADFRRRDVAAGGQGAPLAPLFHEATFREIGTHRVLLNIGGIANVTIFDSQPDGTTIGFDTGPGNGLLDAWVELHHGLPMDMDGKWAATGNVDLELLAHLQRDPYFSLPPPKSTGKEFFNLDWLRSTLNSIDRHVAPAHVQRTLVELTVTTVEEAIRNAAPHCEEVLLCGGGAHNPVLVESLANCLKDASVKTTADVGIDPDYIEAMTFAWLASRTLKGMTGNLPSVTGAKHAVILGAIYPGGSRD